MQTTKWGPEGWKVFHTIPFFYEPEPTPANKRLFKKFFTNLQCVLPCKYCRESYKEFIKEIPIDKYLNSSCSLFYWTYLMHNRVNRKLREQGYLHEKDPTPEEVFDTYFDRTERDKARPNEEPLWVEPLLLFLGTIVFNYSDKDLDKKEQYPVFISMIPDLFAAAKQDIREMDLYKQYIKENNPKQALTDLDSMKQWYFGLVSAVKPDLFRSYESYDDFFESRRAGCSKNTCRKSNPTTTNVRTGTCTL